ncbi:hypothetical protein Ddc_13497 [Ditylenchus destructor]|nr:hypothetical protein Ddc_13497 [Ditylenchus destructor]
MTSAKTVTFLFFFGCVLVDILKASDFVDLLPDRCQGWAAHSFGLRSFCINKFYFEKDTNIPKTQCTLCPKMCAETCEKWREMIPKWQAESTWANSRDRGRGGIDDESSSGSSSSSS